MLSLHSEQATCGPCEPCHLPTPQACREAHARLGPLILRTPVRALHWLSTRLRRPVLVKLEHIQHAGSFKFRGALNALLQIPRDMPVVASSAGNHSLAIAEAARRTGHEVVICMPLTASPIKRERLAAYNVVVIDRGSTLDEAIAHGRNFARQRGYAFVSPYNDVAVIAGQSTIAQELVEDVPNLETVVLPVGGGGLATGIGLGLESAGSGARIHGVQPQRFAALARTLESGVIHREVYRPSLADGLLVNLDADAVTVDYARRCLAGLHLLDEESIAAGSLALFARESLLCEPSGAIGVAAALAGRLDDLPGEGPLVIVLTGGNMTLGTLARLIGYPFHDAALLQALELHHRGPEDEPVFRPVAAEPPLAGERTAWSAAALGRSVQARIAAVAGELRDFTGVCRAEGLAVPDAETRLLETVVTEATSMAARAADPQTGALERERLLRLGSRVVAFLDQAVAWQAPAYDQAGVAAFASVSCQQSAMVNYTRYASPKVAELEEALTCTLGLDPHDASLLATSSGMAAYTLVEAFLLRHVLDAGDAVVCQPSLYFETLEQLRTHRHLKTVLATDDDAEAIVAAVASHRAKAVFVEPLTNTLELRLLDIPRLLSRLDAAAVGPLFVVIDGTMLSGALDPFACVRSLRHVELLYTESGSKYLQAGLDLATLGLVACTSARRPVFERLRRNTGTILYDAAAAMVPRIARADYLARLKQMSRNATRVSDCLARLGRSAGAASVRPVFPGRAEHRDHAAAQAYAHLGGIVTLRFRPGGLNNRWLLEAAIDHVLAQARRRSVPLTKGVSFGFSSPRISAAWAMSETSMPFMRLSVGDGDGPATEAFIEALAAGLTGFLDSMPSRYIA